MKKNLMVVFLIILVTFLIIFINKNLLKLNDKNVFYAIQVDGQKTSDFPEKGLYKVEVSCNNATGIWDYDDWKLIINEINDDVSCGISFVSISKKFINDYIYELSLSDNVLGTGKIVNESVEEPNFSNATTIGESIYENIKTYYNSTQFSTTGDAVSNVFDFDGEYWVTNPNNMITFNNGNVTFNWFYNFEFEIKNDGNYQLCYEFEKDGTIFNSLQIYENNNTGIANEGTYTGNSSIITNCVPLKTNTRIKVSQYSTDKFTKLKFKVQKSNQNNIINTGIRYQGKDPNNYILFNNELWRIIGLFDEFSHGQTNLNLVKIVRNESIHNSISYDSNNGSWDSSNLKQLLNNYYYNKTNANDTNLCKGQFSKIDCDYTNIGINSKYRSFIKNTDWYLGVMPSINTQKRVIDWYKFERDSNSIYPNGIFVDRNYIGIMYPSDLALSTLKNECGRNSGWNERCSKNSWINSQGFEWLLNQGCPNLYNCSTTSNYFLSASYYGSINYEHGSRSASIRPTLYLNENVYVLDGDGSITDPYIIGMD